MENTNFLKKFKGIGNAPEVMNAKKRTEKRTGEKVKGDFESLIQNYLDRLTEFKENLNQQKNEKIRERGAERAKRIIMDKFLTKYADIPENYWKEKDEQGNMGPFVKELNDHGLLGDWDRMDEDEKAKYKKDYASPLLEDQKISLEEWLDYFLSEGSGDIPDYLKYWVFRSVTGLQEYEKPKDWTKEKEISKRSEMDEVKNKEGQFPRRSKNSLKKFPDLQPEALRCVTENILSKYQGKNYEFGYDIQSEELEKFKQYLEQENFAKLYAWAMESFNPIPEKLLPITDGEWKKYPQGSNLNEVVETLKGKGTGLCIAGRGAARRYLDNGDLHIFYSNDEEGKPTFPRIAIHSKGNQIAEMRGIAYKQNMDPFIADVASAKCLEFSNGREYEEKSRDMKRLTEIDNKNKAKEQLTKDDLIFLYEIDAPIKYLGMTKDPRIAEIRNQRNPKEDALIVLDCAPEEIAWNQNEINDKTKAYIGEWNMDVFQTLKNYPNITHLYESFPYKKIFLQTLETDPSINSPEKAEKAIKDKNIYLSDWGKYILEKTEFSKTKEKYDLVRFTVEQLGFSRGATTTEIFNKAKEKLLELCPAEVGPHLRLQYNGREWMLIAMEQITDRDGDPDVFYLSENGGQLRLYGSDAEPDYEWYSDIKFVFRFRKLETKKL